MTLFMNVLLLNAGDARANIFNDVVHKVENTAHKATDPLKKVGNIAGKVSDKVMHAPTSLAKHANKVTDTITKTTNHMIDKTGVGHTFVGQSLKAGVSAVGDTSKQFQTDVGNVTEIEMRYTGGLPFALQKQTVKHFAQEYNNNQHNASTVPHTPPNAPPQQPSLSDMDDIDRLLKEIDEDQY